MATTSGYAPASSHHVSQWDKDKAHMKNVYTALAGTMLTAAFGAYLSLTSGVLYGSHMFCAIGGFACLMGLGATRGTVTLERMAMLLVFGFLAGASAGPLIDAVARIDPTIPMTAFLYSSVLFSCFSLAALTAPSRQYLYLGGVLGSAVSMLAVGSLINLFVGSFALYQMQLYGGLLVFSGFVVYDTQKTLEKHHLGDKDYLWHAVDLFVDFMAVFKRIMIVLAQNQQQREKGKRANNRRR